MDADIYVLAKNRDKKTIIKILDKYLPERVYQIGDSDDRYEYWDDAKEVGNQPSIFFDSEEDLLDFLEKQSGVLFRPSWRSVTQSEIRACVLYYFEDDSLVIGLSINQGLEREDSLLKELKSLLESNYGYVAYHVPPAYGREAFINQCKMLDQN